MGRLKKARRQFQAALCRDPRNRRAPAPWDAVFLPHINPLGTAIALAFTLAPESLCERCATTQSINQGCMFLLHDSDNVQRILGQSRPTPSQISADDIPKVLWQAGEMASRPAETRPDDEISPGYKVEVGRRLRRLRIALEHEELRQFAFDTGVSEGNLGNWERGVSLAPADYIERLRRSLGPGNITHDWIYSGDPSGLRPELRKKLMKKPE